MRVLKTEISTGKENITKIKVNRDVIVSDTDQIVQVIGTRKFSSRY